MPALTLARALELDMTLTAWCNGCGRFHDLDLAPLIARFGGAFKAIDLDRHLVCRKCGSRDVTARAAPRTAPKFW